MLTARSPPDWRCESRVVSGSDSLLLMAGVSGLSRFRAEGCNEGRRMMKDGLYLNLTRICIAHWSKSSSLWMPTSPAQLICSMFLEKELLIF